MNLTNGASSRSNPEHPNESEPDFGFVVENRPKRERERELGEIQVMTACYMINRMPSSILQNQTPFLVLFPTQKPYHLSLHPIGFVCFVHCLESGRGKLAPKAVKCVFLGYSRLQKRL
ncbi:hypothetical protein OSB04_019697 [Centaurea solstitialis]|uniref:Retroviral polymerase SH3-like domain-containing protein n=1 Tax=Centaurea solstitialis TaxID=347529 RepID=A0AA38SQT7_9ASTR|nr:hypothetical protein OSB04_019697 [Centaurea solstitialis]